MVWEYVLVLFFFFKQKTAYEMRISDWSSDVCSSDLQLYRRAARRAGGEGGVPLRCAGALCRRSAAIVARGVPGRRNPECDVGRDQGGLRVVPLETEFAARLAADTTTFAFCWREIGRAHV